MGDGRLEWLDGVLGGGKARHRLVFFHTPPLDPRPGENHRLRYPLLRRGLTRTPRRRGIELAFASHIHDYAEGTDAGTRYVITGGLGAREGSTSASHYVRVEVDGERLRWQRVDLESASCAYSLFAPARRSDRRVRGAVGEDASPSAPLRQEGVD